MSDVISPSPIRWSSCGVVLSGILWLWYGAKDKGFVSTPSEGAAAMDLAENERCYYANFFLKCEFYGEKTS
jgi:hypothetical protein